MPVVASLNGVTPGGWTDFACQLADAGADAIELNLYDLATDLDETGDQIERPPSRRSSPTSSLPSTIPVIGQALALLRRRFPHFVARLERAGAAGVAVFNRFYQPDVDPDTLDVDRHLHPFHHRRAPAAPPRPRPPPRAHRRSHSPSTGGVHQRHATPPKPSSAAPTVVQIVSALLDGRAPPPRPHPRASSTTWLDEHGYRTVDRSARRHGARQRRRPTRMGTTQLRPHAPRLATPTGPEHPMTDTKPDWHGIPRDEIPWRPKSTKTPASAASSATSPAAAPSTRWRTVSRSRSTR